VAFAAMMLDAATNLTSTGLALLAILILSAIPFLCAITARLIRALLAKQRAPWRRVAVQARQSTAWTACNLYRKSTDSRATRI
jgi:hypothetical protein